MPELSSVTPGPDGPRVSVPRSYNAAHDLLTRNLLSGRAAKAAYLDDHGELSYGELAVATDRAANALRGLGLAQEDRVLLALHDSRDFPIVFLGAIKAGIVPIPVNTLLPATDYAFMLADSRAKALVVSAPLWPTFEPLLAQCPALRAVVIAGTSEVPPPAHSLGQLLAAADAHCVLADTTADDICFWLYSSGSTGSPKGTLHLHSSLIHTAELFARHTLGLRESDVVFSAAKLFFAYGLGNALSFPLAVGATTVLMAERPTPEAVFRRLCDYRPTIFCGVPTLYAAMLAHPSPPRPEALSLRLCTSAGEALPPEVGRRFQAHFGVEILDGIGSTEMLHIFLSNRPGDVRYGSTGKPVTGYRVRLMGEHGHEVGPNELGELQVCGPSSAIGYWNNRARTLDTFHGPWTRAGDKFSRDEDGYYHYGGRSDDMLKVSGQYVSPFEVEAALGSHQSVLESAVVGAEDDEGLLKPRAFVVLKDHGAGSDELAAALKAHVKSLLAPHKYPRWISFVPELPKTATGKIQRYKLRQPHP